MVTDRGNREIDELLRELEREYRDIGTHSALYAAMEFVLKRLRHDGETEDAPR